MSCMFELAMYWIGGLGLLIAAWMIALEVRDNRTMNCRACSAELDRRGGYHVPEVGAGFCESCARDLNRYVRKP